MNFKKIGWEDIMKLFSLIILISMILISCNQGPAVEEFTYLFPQVKSWVKLENGDIVGKYMESWNIKMNKGKTFMKEFQKAVNSFADVFGTKKLKLADKFKEHNEKRSIEFAVNIRKNGKNSFCYVVTWIDSYSIFNSTYTDFYNLFYKKLLEKHKSSVEHYIIKKRNKKGDTFIFNGWSSKELFNAGSPADSGFVYNISPGRTTCSEFSLWNSK